MHGELERMDGKMVMTYFKVLFQHLMNVHPQSGQPVPWLAFQGMYISIHTTSASEFSALCNEVV